MHKNLPCFLWTLMAIFLISTNSYAVVRANEANLSNSPTFKVTKDNLETSLGRKLTFREKLVLPLIKGKIKKGLSADRAVAEGTTDGMAIAGFVTGLVGLFVFGIVLGILGIVFSTIALKRIKRDPEVRKGRGLAIAGLVTGIVGLVGWTIILLIALSA